MAETQFKDVYGIVQQEKPTLESDFKDVYGIVTNNEPIENTQFKDVYNIVKQPQEKKEEPSTSIGGVAKSLGAGVMAGATFIPQTLSSGIQVLQDVSGFDFGAKKIDDVVDNARNWWEKRIGKSKAERLIGNAAETIGALSSAAGAIAATGGAASTALLPVMSIGAGLEKTGESLEEGQPRLNAYGAGVLTTATEYLTEKIPLSILQDPARNFISRFVGGVISDSIGELAATATEMELIDSQVLGKDNHFTADNYKDIILDTIAVSTLSSLGLSAGAQALHNDVERSKFGAEQISKLNTPQSETTSPDTIATDASLEIPIEDKEIEPKEPVKETPIGIPLNDERFKGDKYAEVLEMSRQESKNKDKFTLKKAMSFLGRNIWNVTYDIDKELSKYEGGQAVIDRKNLIAGAHSEAIRTLTPKIREIYGSLNKKNALLFDGYKSAVRALERRKNMGAEYKLEGNVTEADINTFLDKIPTELKENFRIRNEKLKSAFDDLLVLAEKNGLRTPEETARLRAKGTEYLPHEILEYSDPITQRKDSGGKIISVRDSGINGLTEEGSIKLAETDSRYLLEQATVRLLTRVFRNKAATQMAIFARENKGNDIVRERNPNEIIPPNKTAISFMENGKRKELILPNELANQWVKSDPQINQQTANALSWLSGTKILRAMATTFNPAFTITNPIRDVFHIYLTTDSYSKHSPIALLELGNDIRQVVSDKIKIMANEKFGTKFKTENFKDRYIENGGGMEFYSYQGKLGLKRDSILSASISSIEDVLSFAGTQSEEITRLSLFNRAKKNGKGDVEATAIARGYLDFSQGGSAVKAINNVIPFLNANIQATRGILRSVGKNPTLFGYKALNLASMAAALYWANHSNYEKDMEEVPEYEKRTHFIIMTPYTFLDSEGNERRYYVRLPKDKGQEAFTAIGEGMAAKMMGKDVDSDSISQSVQDFIPIGINESMPPVLRAMIGYSANKDFWKRDDIWKGESVEPAQEFNKYTPESMVKLGSVTGMSPVRLDYAIKQVFTSGNAWTALIGKEANEIFSTLTPEQRNEMSKELFEKKPMVKQFLRSTQPNTKEILQAKKDVIIANTRKLTINREFDSIAERYIEGQTDINEIKGFLQKVEPYEKKRLINRLNTQKALKGIPNKNFWFSLIELPPEARAINYYDKWIKLNPQQRRELDMQSIRIKGFRSDRFNRQFNNSKKYGG